MHQHQTCQPPTAQETIPTAIDGRNFADHTQVSDKCGDDIDQSQRHQSGHRRHLPYCGLDLLLCHSVQRLQDCQLGHVHHPFHIKKISSICSENLVFTQWTFERRRYKANSSAQVVCAILKFCSSKATAAQASSQSSRASLRRARLSFVTIITATHEKAINSALTPRSKSETAATEMTQNP